MCLTVFITDDKTDYTFRPHHTVYVAVVGFVCLYVRMTLAGVSA